MAILKSSMPGNVFTNSKYLLFFSIIMGISYLINPLFSFILIFVIASLCFEASKYRFSSQNIFFCCLFVMIFLEGDYPDYEAIVEKIYAPLLTQTYVPIVSPYEIVGIILLLWLLIKEFKFESNNVQRSFITLCLATGLHFGVGFIQMILGLSMGGRLQVAFWQMKSFMVFPVWASLGFLVVRSSSDVAKFLSIFIFAVGLKTIYNMEVLIFGMGGTRGTREYISSHIGSLFLSVSMILIVLRLRFLRLSREIKNLYLFFLSIGIWVWFVNDRRASLMGTVLSVLFSIMVVFQSIPKEILRRAIVIIGSFAIVVGLTWNMPSPTPGGIVRGFTTHGDRMNENEIDYRDIENFNLFTGISYHPLGRGYGFPFIRYMEMPNIFDLAEILSWVPHNSMLMIWLFGGPQNVASLAILFVFSFYVSLKLFRQSDNVHKKTLGILSFMMMVQWLIYVWADMAWSFVATVSAPGALVGASAGLLARIGEENKSSV